MFWRKKKEVEKVERVLLPKAEYRLMCRIILDAEKYDTDNQIEVRNALLLELKNQIDRVMECPPVKDYEKIRANREDRPPTPNLSAFPKYDNPPPPPSTKDKK